ncbi:MAG: tyrosine-type recombinase/integrase [Methylocella sp.]|nr:MAG: integrase [Hyphomicrobiales bacterium]
MAKLRCRNKLTARGIAGISRNGRHSDGGGLYLSITKDGGRRWIFRFTVRGRVREMGLGSAIWVPLAEARQLAGKAREAVRAGIDPIDARRSGMATEAARKTFGQCATAVIAKKSLESKSPEHRRQWKSTLENHCAPLWNMPVGEIDMAAVLSVLQPIWPKIPETASRLRARIEAVLDYAKAHGLRVGENPAAWRGNLKLVLPKRGSTRGHHAAMDYKAGPAFMAQLRQQDTMASMALQLLILCASRSGEALGMTWSEIDLASKIWTIPASRMKGAILHRIPLSSPAMAILERLTEFRTSEHIFPGFGHARHLSSAGLSNLAPTGCTIHGFRSSFRDWCGEETDFPREIAEAALAHVAGNSTERSYRRGDALEKRRVLMETWAQYLGASV